MMRFRTFNYVDKACTGMEAFSMLAPADWSLEGGIRWSPDNVMMPATQGFKVSGSDISMEVLPGEAFFWTNLPQVRLSHPVGSRYLGATVCPVFHAGDVIKRILLPAYRGDAGRVVIREESPATDIGGTLGFESAFKNCGISSSEGASLRIEYAEDGKTYEEELFCTVTSFRFAVPSGGSDICVMFWIADHIFSFRAPAGTLDGMAGTFQSMVHSYRINPWWLDKYNRIVLFLKDRQMYRHFSLRQLSADVEKAGTSHDAGMRSYALRQSAYRWIADGIGRRGSTGEYYDPIQQICVRLPSGYDHAWASDTGEYLLSDHRDIHPDSGFAEIWKSMEPLSIEPPGPGPSAASAT